MKNIKVPKSAKAVQPVKLKNKEFKVVFEPYDRNAYDGKRRFGIGAGSLANYIGLSNANTAIAKAFACKEDKLRLKFRAHGIIDFYIQ